VFPSSTLTVSFFIRSIVARYADSAHRRERRPAPGIAQAEPGRLARNRPAPPERCPELALDDLFVWSTPEAVFAGEKALSLGQVLFLCSPFLESLDRVGVLPSTKSLEPVADAHHSALLGRRVRCPFRDRSYAGASFIPAVGEDTLHLAGADSQLPTALEFKKSPPFGDNDVDIYPKQDKFRAVFAADVPAKTAAAMLASQRPPAAATGAQLTTAAAWETIASWALIGRQDRTITRATFRGDARRRNDRRDRLIVRHDDLASRAHLPT